MDVSVFQWDADITLVMQGPLHHAWISICAELLRLLVYTGVVHHEHSPFELLFNQGSMTVSAQVDMNWGVHYSEFPHVLEILESQCFPVLEMSWKLINLGISWKNPGI